jgi:hypothetical protein
MAIVDERGRVGGRVNLIDAVAAFLILVLIPVAFGAYLLFRTPPAVLTGINPKRLYQGSNLRIEVQGENLRPFMRVRFDTLQGRTFQIGGTRGAMVDLPDLEPGVYDVVLYDYMQEVSRLPKALTILPLAPVPTVTVEVSGAFKGLAAERVKLFKTGDKYMTRGDLVAEALSIGTPAPSSLMLKVGSSFIHVPITGQVDLPASLKVRCAVVSNADGTLKCLAAGPVQQSDVLPGSTLSLAAPDGWATFQIDKVLAEGAQNQ